MILNTILLCHMMMFLKILWYYLFVHLCAISDNYFDGLNSCCSITLSLVQLAERSNPSQEKQQAPLSPSSTSPSFSSLPILVVVVLSSPTNVLQRDAIRQTWLTLLMPSLQYHFVIGTHGLSIDDVKQLQLEHSLHRDLLLLPDIVEHYQGLTPKLVAAFKHLNKSQFKYLLKSDDDSYIHIHHLVQELKSFPDDSLYWGFFRGNAKVKTKGKWKEKEWNICDNYLPYALGGGYVLSKDLVTYIAVNSRNLRHFRSEDVTVGAWLATIETNRKHDSRFNTEYQSRGCSNSYLIMHKQSPQEMRALHRNLMESGKMCQVEKVEILSYVYNWDVLPSQCCIRENKNIS